MLKGGDERKAKSWDSEYPDFCIYMCEINQPGRPTIAPADVTCDPISFAAIGPTTYDKEIIRHNFVHILPVGCLWGEINRQSLMVFRT